MTTRIHEIRRSRARLVDARRSAADKYAAIVQREADLPAGEELPDEDAVSLETLSTEIASLDARISKVDERLATVEAAMASDAAEADPVDGERGHQQGVRRGVAATARRVDHETDPSLVVAGMVKMVARGGSFYHARDAAMETYGENHPVYRALMASTASAGGLMVPPDFVTSLIEVLRPKTAVRDAGPRIMAMPRGTMTLPRQSQTASASYGSEIAAIPVSEQTVDAIVASYKKLTALVPISNDLMRYSDPSVDAMVRDDLALVLATKEDLAFIRGDGTQGSPMGFRSFVPAANLISANASYTLATAASELGGALNKLETANVTIVNPCWIMHPRSKNYLLNVQNTNGFYVYRDEMTLTKTLLGIPFKMSTQIPVNLTVGGNSDCSEIYLVEMTQALLLDAMTLELAVSREGSYVDSLGATVSVFQSDQTLIRAIAEHDFQMRHNEAIAVITGVRWAPAIS